MEKPTLRPATYRKHGAPTWEAIRRDYLAGVTALELSRRYGVNVSTLRQRATAERWRRKDQVEAPADGEAPRRAAAAPRAAPRPAVETARTPDAAVRQAFAEAARAQAEGRPKEAQDWARLARQMSAISLPGDDPAGEREEGAIAFRRFDPTKPTAFDAIASLVERRLDQLFRKLWLGGLWDEQLGRPAYCMDRDGRIVETWTVEDAWFDGPPPPRDRMTRPLPPVSDLPQPPLAWVLEVWLDDWNARHPDDPATPVDAMLIHQLFTRDPRLEWGYNDRQLMVAKTLWEEEQRRQGLPGHTPDPPRWADKTERNLAAWREKVKAMGWDQ